MKTTMMGTKTTMMRTKTTMMRTKTRMLGLDVTTTIVADGFTTGVLDLTKSQADVENSFASTAES